MSIYLSIYLLIIPYLPTLCDTYDSNELGELELELDRDDLGDVGHGPDQLVVVAQ